MSQQQIIKELLLIEDWAQKLTQKCRDTRKLIEADVSTSATGQQALSKEEIEKIIKKRRNNLKVA